MDRINEAIALARASRDKIDGNRLPRQPGDIKVSEDVADWSALTEFAVSEDIFDQSHIVAHKADHAATPFDMMRSAILHQMQLNKWTRVAITSPDAGCGKTTVTLNLAFSLARMSDLRVMVIELDLRRPMMSKALGLNLTRGLSVFPPEGAETRLLRYGPRLAFAINSAPIDSPAELLSSITAAATIDAIEARYRPDIILFDMPPLSAGDDTFAFLDQIDCALVIAAAEETSINLIDQCGKGLAERTQVLGVVLNKCRLMDPDNYYG